MPLLVLLLLAVLVLASLPPSALSLFPSSPPPGIDLPRAKSL
jgi:hypothetical protein